MRKLLRYLFVILDSLLPDLGSLVKLRGDLAIALMGFTKAQGPLYLGRGVKFDVSTSEVIIEPDVCIQSGCKIGVWSGKLVLQSGALLQPGTQIKSSGQTIIIERNAKIGMDTIIYANSHETGDKECRAGETIGNPITIGSGSWIGIRSTIFKDVGTACVVGAGAYVLSPIPENSSVFGNPARQMPGVKLS
jgi:acetyltransferase-like isoleucine patch superfamily enzyme